MRLDTPLKQEWSLSERKGHLRLHGGPYDLSSPESPTLLLRKQTAFDQSFSATLDFHPSGSGYEAGIVIWWSMFSYASIGIIAGEKSDTRVVTVKLPTEEIGLISVS